MMTKKLKFSLIIGATLLLCACGRRETISNFNSLNYLYAYPITRGYRPLRISSENGSLFLQYIMNETLLSRVTLVFHSKKSKDSWGDEIAYYFFHGFYNGNKTGSYQIPARVFGNQLWYTDDGYRVNRNTRFITYRHEGRTVLFYVRRLSSEEPPIMTFRERIQIFISERELEWTIIMIIAAIITIIVAIWGLIKLVNKILSKK